MINVGNISAGTTTVQLADTPKLLVCLLSDCWIFAMRNTSLIDRGGINEYSSEVVGDMTISSSHVLSFRHSASGTHICTVYCIY